MTESDVPTIIACGSLIIAIFSALKIVSLLTDMYIEKLKKDNGE